MTKSTGKKRQPAPATTFPEASDTLHEQNGRLWIPLRGEWRDVTGKPEEIVAKTSSATSTTITATPSPRWTKNGGPCTGTGARAPMS